MTFPFSCVSPGEKLWPDDYGVGPDHCRAVLEGEYDVPVEFAEPPVVLDIGANVGAFARWALWRWPGCSIHCYEPHTGNYELLKRTLKTYRGNGTVCLLYPHPQAVLDVSMKMPLNEGAFNCGEWSLFDTKAGKGSVLVDVISADLLPKADVLKIDAEGAEPAILGKLYEAGRIQEFAAIMVEYHADVRGREMRDALVRQGFELVGEKEYGRHRGVLRFVRVDGAENKDERRGDLP